MGKPSEAVGSFLKFSVPSLGMETPFFRDTAALKVLKLLVQRRLRDSLSPGMPLRVWVPQCSTGQDAYSVAIWLIEATGNHWREVPLCVFSTDSDEDSLSRARAGRYPQGAGRGMSRDRLGRFFIQEAKSLSVRPFVRDACRFASYNLTQSPPFSRLDLIACRETLAAMPPVARVDTLRFFHSALAPGGVLLDQTGSAADTPELFAPVGRGKSYIARRVSVSTSGLGGRIVPIIDARLRESEERFQHLLSQAENAILVRDTETDLILQANEAAQRLFGWSLPKLLEMRGKDLLVPPADVRRPKDERRSEERLRMPHYRRKDGTVFPADTSTAFLMMLKGRPCNLWMVQDATQRLRSHAGRKRELAQDVLIDSGLKRELAQDVLIDSGRKREEDQDTLIKSGRKREEDQDTLIKSGRKREEGQDTVIKSGRKREEEHDVFVGDVVHELRSPIAVIRGSVETLRKGVRSARARSTFLKFIENHATRMAHLVDKLLDLSAADSLKRETKPARVLLAQVMVEIVSAFIPVAKRRGISITVAIPGDLAVLADPADLPHVFGNLLDNAIKFSSKGGKVFVHGRSEGAEGILSVKNTGGGIAPEDLSRIFERFFRSERTRRTKGAGLGLAIVHGIVKANQGRVVAENDPAGGVVFHVALPLALEPHR